MSIDDLTNKLLMLIKNDNSNSDEAYNYCKILKELLIKKQETDDIKSKYQNILTIYSRTKIKADIERKEKKLITKSTPQDLFSKKKI